jgi:peptidoglycan hydrolase-like protein with peptidoglycan-binding domain
MSFDRTHARDGSHGHAGAAGANATPGKHTQVDRASGGGSHGVQLASIGAARRGAGDAGDAGEGPEEREPRRAGASAAGAGGVNTAVLKRFLTKHEGYVEHVYLDSRGFPTAGIGHLLPRGRYRVGQKISAAQINEWFEDDLAEAIQGARQNLGAAAYGRLNEARKMVVIDMAFNLGSAGFGEFNQTIDAIQSGAYARAAERMLQSLWASQVGDRAREDAAMMRTGRFAGGGGDRDGDGDGDAPSIADVRAGRGVLKAGDRGAAVARVQRLLRVSDDGVFGPKTERAVERFQRAHRLTADGIVGSKTLDALEDRADRGDDDRRDGDGRRDGDRKRDGDDDRPEVDRGTGGVRAPDDLADQGDDRDDDRDDDRRGDRDDDRDDDRPRRKGPWSPAPSLEAVKSGSATLRRGHRGPAVKHAQKLLAVDADGKFGPATRAAVLDFQRAREGGRNDGAIDDRTLAELTRHPVGTLEGESREGAAQRQRMLSIARGGSDGRRPDGRCYFHICQFLIQCGGYGKIKNPYQQFPIAYLPEAHHFADLMNLRGPGKFGLERLSVSNPYNAPAGSIVVVAAGSPGTAHPTAGDIAIADGHGNFYNGGEMSYGGREGWSASRGAQMLGCYVPL